MKSLLCLVILVTELASISAQAVFHLNAVRHNVSEPSKVLVVDHVPKCGGTFLINLAKQSVDRSTLLIVQEQEQLQESDMGEDKFIVGVIRNPFDYYISLWAYKTYKDRLGADLWEDIIPLGDPAGSHPEDPARFARFLKIFSDPDLGLLSFLFYYSYLDAANLVRTTTWHYKGTVGDAFGPSLDDIIKKQKILKALRRVSLDTSPVDCWVHTEDASENARVCFEQFAQLGGVVDFVALNEVLAEGHVNSNEHEGCNRLYDRELREYVLAADAEMFRIFGYSSQCES
mmetsp:Transcript_8387/g.18809  ORF Transcript_8387/g.18809 Transcript_8387/m.18809 type:complete len:287 (-) Transcript_8387:100-960(-)